MKKQRKKQSGAVSFSYVDVFLLLLAGLILSFGLWALTEWQEREAEKVCEISLSAYLDEKMLHAIPRAGDALFNEEGETCGQVLEASVEEIGARYLLRVHCRAEGDRPETGDEYRLETTGFVRTMGVYAVTDVEER